MSDAQSSLQQRNVIYFLQLLATKTQGMTDTTVGVKLDQETRDRLRRLGQSKDRSTHWMMKEAVARYLAVEERYEQERAEDDARWQRFVETGNVIPHAAVAQRIDELVARKRPKARGK